jgi:redox-sensitive bicupin YhaK (pirin superfamily)
MITVRKAEDRGHYDHGWLDTRHTFSFASYHDPRQMGFRALRVVNEDRVAPGQGFGRHGHRDMEILSYVLEGALAHEDSTGGKGVLRPGEIQRMSAGTGVMHSEFNGSGDAPVHFLQIWLVPDRTGIAPSYEQRPFPEAERRGRLRLVAAPGGGGGGALAIQQDARVYASLLGAGERARLELAPGRHAWIQVARGEVLANGVSLRAGDGAAISDERAVELEGKGKDVAELLAFDLA